MTMDKVDCCIPNIRNWFFICVLNEREAIWKDRERPTQFNNFIFHQGHILEWENRSLFHFLIVSHAYNWWLRDCISIFNHFFLFSSSLFQFLAGFQSKIKLRIIFGLAFKIRHETWDILYMRFQDCKNTHLTFSCFFVPLFTLLFMYRGWWRGGGEVYRNRIFWLWNLIGLDRTKIQTFHTFKFLRVYPWNFKPIRQFISEKSHFEGCKT